MGGLPKIRTPGAQPTAASCPRNQDHDLSDVRGWAEIAHRPPKLRDRSRNRRSPHDGHGPANAVDRMHRRTRSRRRNVLGAAQGTAPRAVDGRARDYRGGVLPARLASRPAASTAAAPVFSASPGPAYSAEVSRRTGVACETGMTEEIWAHLPPATAAGSQAG